MATYQCAVCGETVPVARYCLTCGSLHPDPPLPTDAAYVDGLTTRLSERAAAADHDSVSFDRLRSTFERYDRPLGGYLYPEEQPEAVFSLGKTDVTAVGEESWSATAGFLQSGHLLVTENRLLAVTPDEDGTQLLPVPTSDVTDVTSKSTLLASVVSVEAADGYTYDFHLEGVSDEELHAAAALIGTVSARRESASARAASFVGEADEAVAESETAEAALRAVADLFADRDERTVFDHAVADAESVGELFATLSNSPGVAASPTAPESGDRIEDQTADRTADGATGRPANRPARPGNGSASGPLPARRPRLSEVGDQLAYTAQNADPAEVGKYTVAAGLGFGAAAFSAPISTPIGLALIAAGGAATGAYASAHPDSLAARIDPIEVATSAKVSGRRWQGNSAPGGVGTGAALGAADHLREEVDVDDAAHAQYAHWVANVDYDAVTEGAERGRRAAERSEEFSDPDRAAALGAGLGLAYGYTDREDRAELDALLDDDLSDALRPPERAESGAEPDDRDDRDDQHSRESQSDPDGWDGQDDRAGDGGPSNGTD